jgi:beta-lactamase superfamily II metal-dependent hydrolase
MLVASAVVPMSCSQQEPISLSLPTMTVHFIDVGQGEATLIDCGITEVVIDGGNVSPGIVSYLEGYVDGPIELLVGTSPDDDHVGGLTAVLESFEVQQYFICRQAGTSEVYAAFRDALHHNTNSGMIGGGEGTVVVGYNPELYFEGLNTGGDPSLVLELTYGKIKFFFEGDAGQEAEARMLKDEAISNVDILKVGDHASGSASSQGFLAAAKPKVAIYSPGIGNGEGCPDPEVVAALEAIGAKTYGTDVNGTVVVSTDGERFKVVTQK